MWKPFSEALRWSGPAIGAIPTLHMSFLLREFKSCRVSRGQRIGRPARSHRRGTRIAQQRGIGDQRDQGDGELDAVVDDGERLP